MANARHLVPELAKKTMCSVVAAGVCDAPHAAQNHSWQVDAGAGITHTDTFHHTLELSVKFVKEKSWF
jgi:hypothetical protein